MNTREFRYRKRLEDERHKLIEKAMKTIPNYHPPSDYRRPTKTQEKVYVPVNDYPEINFSMLTDPLTLLQAPLFLFPSPCYRLLQEAATVAKPAPLTRILPCKHLYFEYQLLTLSFLLVKLDYLLDLVVTRSRRWRPSLELRLLFEAKAL